MLYCAKLIKNSAKSKLILKNRKHFGEGIGLNLDLFLRDRVDELDFLRNEGYPASGIRPFGSVFKVPLDRGSCGGKLHSDLMLPSCEERHFQKGISVPLCHDPIPES